METRLIEISLDTAKRWYEQGGELKDNVWFVAASFSGIEKYSPKQMLDYFVFMDGEPFGIKEE